MASSTHPGRLEPHESGRPPAPRGTSHRGCARRSRCRHSAASGCARPRALPPGRRSRTGRPYRAPGPGARGRSRALHRRPMLMRTAGHRRRRLRVPRSYERATGCPGPRVTSSRVQQTRRLLLVELHDFRLLCGFRRATTTRPRTPPRRHGPRRPSGYAAKRRAPRYRSRNRSAAACRARSACPTSAAHQVRRRPSPGFVEDGHEVGDSLGDGEVAMLSWREPGRAA